MSRSSGLLDLMQAGSEVLEKATEVAALPAPVEVRCDVSEAALHIWTHETGMVDQYAAVNRVSEVIGVCPEIETWPAPRDVRAQGVWEGVRVSLRAARAEPRGARKASQAVHPNGTERTARLLRETRNWIVSLTNWDTITELSLTDRSARYGRHLLIILASDAEAARTLRLPMSLRLRWLAGGLGRVRCIVRTVQAPR